MRTVLLGDSHLDRVRGADLARLGPDVLNAAVGGATALDVLPQALAAGVGPDDAVVVSVGTNDAAPWRAVPLGLFRAVLSDLLATVSPARWVLLTSPGVDAVRVGPDAVALQASINGHAETAAGLFGAAGGVVVPARALLAPLGARAYVDDGVHLTPAAYDVLLPAVRAALG